MKKLILALTAAAAIAAPAYAAAGSALDCLQASANNGGFSACLNESAGDPSEAVAAGASRTSGSSPLGAVSLDVGEKSITRHVPTPTGFTEAEDGTLKAGFYNGLDSGFKTVFGGFTGLAVLGIEACGGPYASNAGTAIFYGLGVILSIPGSIIAAVIGAPLGAAAGMIAETVSPGSTSGWFTF